MVVRTLSLSEWFLHYQLKALEKSSFLNPVILKVKLGDRARELHQTHSQIPLSALVLQAVGRLNRKCPETRRILFRTHLGLRYLELSDVRVNFPIEIEHLGKKLTAAMVIKDPDLKSVEEIHQEIRTAKTKDITEHPINNFMATRGNFFWNRWALKALYNLSMRSPRLYAKMGGGSVSLSMLTHADHPAMQLTSIARGHTGLTFCLGRLEESADGAFLHLGVAMDHGAISGVDMARCMAHLSEEILKSFDTLLNQKRITLNPREANV